MDRAREVGRDGAAGAGLRRSPVAQGRGARSVAGTSLSRPQPRPLPLGVETKGARAELRGKEAERRLVGFASSLAR